MRQLLLHGLGVGELLDPTLHLKATGDGRLEGGLVLDLEGGGVSEEGYAFHPNKSTWRVTST